MQRAISKFDFAEDMFGEALSAEAWATAPRPGPSGDAREQLASLAANVGEYEISVPWEPEPVAQPMEAAAAAPIEAVLPMAPPPEPIEWHPQRPGGIFAVWDLNCPSQYLEQFQLLRTQLLLMRAQAPSDDAFRSVCVTSALDGEGKTFTARNLAATLAMTTGKKILLVETGLRELSFPDQAPALGEVLEQPELWRHAVVEVAGTGLSIIGGARQPGRVDYEPLPALVAELRRHYEWVLLDGPPLLRSTAGEWVASAADGALLVVRQGETPMDRAAEALQRIPASRLAGVVMNRMAPKPRSSWLPKVKIRLKIPRFA